MSIARVVGVIAAASIGGVLLAASVHVSLGGAGRLYGDASCDGQINAIDSALILQFNSGLLHQLPCAANADVNVDGHNNAIDAALILQFAAGLLSHLGPSGTVTMTPPQPTPTPAPMATPFVCGTGDCPVMSFHVTDASSCDSPGNPTDCTVGLGTKFTLAVALVDGAPPEGYIAMQTDVYFGALHYNASAAIADEIVWPDVQGFSLRSVEAPTVAHGASTSLTPPFAPSHYAGNLISLSFTCDAAPAAHDVLLLAYSPTNHFGAGLRVQTGDQGQNLPAASSGPEPVDRNGDTVAEPQLIADRLTIRCGAP